MLTEAYDGRKHGERKARATQGSSRGTAIKKTDSVTLTFHLLAYNT